MANTSDRVDSTVTTKNNCWHSRLLVGQQCLCTTEIKQKQGELPADRSPVAVTKREEFATFM